jgi:hypothetical protein
MSIIDIVKSMFDVSVAISSSVISRGLANAAPRTAEAKTEEREQEPKPWVAEQIAPPAVRSVCPKQNPGNQKQCTS